MSDLPPRVVPVSGIRSKIVETLNDAPEGQWGVLMFPHEGFEGNALDAFVKALGELPVDVEGVRARKPLVPFVRARLATLGFQVESAKTDASVPSVVTVARAKGT
jgi:hypothetical protein